MKFRIIELPPDKHGRKRFQCDVRGTLPNGTNYRKRLTPKVGTLAAADRFANDHWNAVVRGETDGAAKRFPTLRDHWEEFKAVHFAASKRGPLKPATRESYESHWRTHLEIAFGDKRLDEITEVEIKKFAVRLGSFRSPKTVKSVLINLQSILKRAEEWIPGYKAPPFHMPRVEQPEIEFWSFAEFDTLAAEAKRRGIYHHAVVLLGGRAGLRAGEILGLRWEDIDMERRILSIRFSIWRGKEGTPKSNKRRYVPISEDLADALDALPRKGLRVIRAPKVKHPTLVTLRKFVLRCEIGSGIKSSKSKESGQLHKLRHTFGAHLAMRGVSLRIIQELMGHASFTTTLRYAHLAPSTLHEAIGQLTGTAFRGEKLLSDNKGLRERETGLEPD